MICDNCGMDMTLATGIDWYCPRCPVDFKAIPSLGGKSMEFEYMDGQSESDQIDTLKAENTRLREALTTIAADKPSFNEMSGFSIGLQMVARAALTSAPVEPHDPRMGPPDPPPRPKFWGNSQQAVEPHADTQGEIPEGWREVGKREPQQWDYFIAENGRVGLQDGYVRFDDKNAVRTIVERIPR